MLNKCLITVLLHTATHDQAVTELLSNRKLNSRDIIKNKASLLDFQDLKIMSVLNVQV